MNITTLALIGWILAIEFALVACVLLALLLRQSAKRSSTVSSDAPTIATLAPDSPMAERLHTLEQQNTDLSKQLANIQNMIKKLQPHTGALPSESTRSPSNPVEDENKLSPQNLDDFEDEDTEDLIDLFDEGPTEPSKPKTRNR